MATEPHRLAIKRFLMLTAVFVLPMLMLSAYAWTLLPEGARIPTHWNVKGEVDQYSSKTFGLFFLPALVTLLVPGLAVLVRLDPRRKHVEQSGKFLFIVSIGLLTMMAAIHAATILISLGYQLPMDRIVGSCVGALFLLLGNFLGKVRSNFFMGVRTPWTLSSELSWNKTHRLAGKLFVAIGLLSLILTWTQSGVVAVGVLLVSVVLVTLVCVIYSYFVWKQDAATRVG
ncbi:MAG TPA: SdpI family protein [Candidatus Hydrogenedentes bacterium]|nr:SdpI family protein [Candidatus Hydrogenedentota bacterium]